MPTIDKTQMLVTLITVHVCKQEDQQQLVDLLQEGVNTIYRHMQGFISASIHKSIDGVRVTNYAQYRSREDFEKLPLNNAIRPYTQRVAALVSSVDAHLYEVSEVFNG